MINAIEILKIETIKIESTNKEIQLPISDDGYSLCPACGNKSRNKDFRPYDNLGYPSYDICSCCGIEYGFDCEPDSTENDWKNYRERWIRNEISFSIARKMSKDDKIQQLKEIGIEI